MTSFNLGISLDTPLACLRADTLLNTLHVASTSCCASRDIVKQQLAAPAVVSINTDILTELVYGISQSAAEFYTSRRDEEHEHGKKFSAEQTNSNDTRTTSSVKQLTFLTCDCLLPALLYRCSSKFNKTFCGATSQGVFLMNSNCRRSFCLTLLLNWTRKVWEDLCRRHFSNCGEFRC